MERAILDTPVTPISNKLSNPVFLNRWSSIKGYMLSKKGIVPIFINKGKAYDFWRKHQKCKQYMIT
jgi:hypothetical protein